MGATQLTTSRDGKSTNEGSRELYGNADALKKIKRVSLEMRVLAFNNLGIAFPCSSERALEVLRLSSAAAHVKALERNLEPLSFASARFK